MLEDLTVDTFAGHLGEVFRVSAGDQAYEFRLIEANDHEERFGRFRKEGGRAPFTLVFRGPNGSPIPQGILHLEHDALGELDIFVVPIGHDAEGVQYEAVFN